MTEAPAITEEVGKPSAETVIAVTESSATVTEEAAPKANDSPKEAPTAESATTIEADAFTLPEGITLDNDLLEKAMPTFAELGLDQEKSQKLINLYSEGLGKAKTAADAYIAEKSDEIFTQRDTARAEAWETEAKADKSITGESIAHAKAAIEAFGSDGLKAALNESGFGNHAEVIKMMAKIGARLGEENKFVSGNTSGGVKDATIVDALFSKKNKE